MAALRAQLTEAYTPATCNRILTAVRGVLKDCWQLGNMSREAQVSAGDIPPIRGYRLPKGHMLAASELGRLFEVCAQDPRPSGRRDAALLALLCGAGLRRSELVHLDVSDYDPVSGALTVHAGTATKTGASLLAMGRPRPSTSGWHGAATDQGCCLWRSAKVGASCRDGSAIKPRPGFSRSAMAAGITQAFIPHDLRHTWISTMLAVGVDLATVADLAGHANIATTAKYGSMLRSGQAQGGRAIGCALCARAPVRGERRIGLKTVLR